MTPIPERRSDAGELRERVATLATDMAYLKPRVAELGDRSHAQGTALTTVTLTVQRIEGMIEEGFARIAQTMAENRTQRAEDRAAAMAEHRELRAQFDPVRADYLDRRAVEAAGGKADERRRPWLLAGFGVALTALTSAVTWAAAHLTWRQ